VSKSQFSRDMPPALGRAPVLAARATALRAFSDRLRAEAHRLGPHPELLFMRLYWQRYGQLGLG
jgi:hypothetical protein